MVQKDELRPIDVLYENKVNDTFPSTGRATLYVGITCVWRLFLAAFALEVEGTTMTGIPQGVCLLKP